MFGKWREAWFWAKVIAAVWLFAALVTNGEAIFEGVQKWTADAPAPFSVADIAQAPGASRPRSFPQYPPVKF